MTGIQSSTRFVGNRQEEVITVLKLLLERRISKQVEESGLYTLMVDGTIDKSYLEIASIVCRYIVENNVGTSGQA